MVTTGTMSRASLSSPRSSATTTSSLLDVNTALGEVYRRGQEEGEREGKAEGREGGESRGEGGERREKERGGRGGERREGGRGEC